MTFHKTVELSELSERDQVWDKHKASSELLAERYSGSQYGSYSYRINSCGSKLEFELLSGELKLHTARFCRVRLCPICQWRRSLKWKARAYQSIPKVVQDFPKHRWLFLTLTVKNCPITDLRKTICEMHEAFKRLTKLKAWCSNGWIKSTEVTKGQDELAHPHFHCLLMVPSSYFSGDKYLSHAKWGRLWQQSLRINYLPVIDVRAIKQCDSALELVPEILKYQTKTSDLVDDTDWLLELTQQLHGTRAISIGGVLPHYMRNQLEDFENNNGEQVDQIKATLDFEWNPCVKRYKLDN